MKYDDFVLEASEATIERDGAKRLWRRFTVRVLSSPGGEMAPDKAISVQCDERALQGQLRQLDRRELDRDGLIALGRLLGLLMLPPAQADAAVGVREMFSRSLDMVGQDAGLRLRLRLPPELASLPWEYVYLDRVGATDAMAGFLALDPRVALIRHEVLAVPAARPKVSGDIKVLAAFASPPEFELLDLEREERGIRTALADEAGMQLTVLRDATLSDLQDAIPGTHIFHFAGHGAFQDQPGDLPGISTGSTGAVALDDGLLAAEKLGVNLRGNHVRLAVLGGCETGRRAGAFVWGGVSSALVRFDVPAVVANQYSILDESAIAFAQHFYRALVGGLPIERAVTAGRIAIYNKDSGGRDWGVPVLYLRAGNGELFEGAADALVRTAARTSAEVDVNVRVKEVAAGGIVVGADVHRILGGTLTAEVSVAGTMFGAVYGLKADSIDGGSVSVSTSAEVVGKGGKMTGAKIRNLGG